MRGSGMQGKLCVVTGATAGLGRATAVALAGQGAKVVVGCRNEARGQVVQDEIRARYAEAEVELLVMDLSDQHSVRTAVVRYLDAHDRLDVVINNAAVFTRRRVVTADGIEMMFATNHLGPFLLTTLLLDALKATAPARIITVTAPSTVRLDFEDLQGERRFSALHAFGASKMCNLLFTYELARRLDGTRVTANAMHPGLMRSSLMREAPLPMRWMLWLVSASPEKAAAQLVHLASAPELANVTGAFFKNGRPIESAPYSRDPAVQQRLWEESRRLACLT